VLPVARPSTKFLPCFALSSMADFMTLATSTEAY